MQTTLLNTPPPQPRKPLRSSAVSIALHLAVLLAITGVLHRTAHIAPYRLPGTTKGVSYLTFYSAGSPPHAESTLTAKKPATHRATPTPHTTPAPPPEKPAEPQSPHVDPGASNSALSGIGQGDISIALQKVFPYPKPDLSTLPHGTHGDVILNAVIDQNGHISDLTLVQGLGPAIDNVVIATVKQWSYTPALMNGSPVVSEQELHFHYERS